MATINPSDDDIPSLISMPQKADSPAPAHYRPDMPYYYQSPDTWAYCADYDFSQQLWYRAAPPSQYPPSVPMAHYTGHYVIPVAPNYVGQPLVGALLPPPPTVAPPRPRTEWTLQSKVAYETLRRIGCPVDLSQCIAGTWSNIRSPKGFNKGEWNEANRMLMEQFPWYMDELQLQEYYCFSRKQREGEEMKRDEKDREKRKRNGRVTGSNAETGRQLEAQDALPSSPAGPSGAPSPKSDQADEGEAAEAPEKPEEEKASEPSQDESKNSQGCNSLSKRSQGTQTDGQAEPKFRMRFVLPRSRANTSRKG